MLYFCLFHVVQHFRFHKKIMKETQTNIEFSMQRQKKWHRTGKKTSTQNKNIQKTAKNIQKKIVLKRKAFVEGEYKKKGKFPAKINEKRFWKKKNVFKCIWRKERQIEIVYLKCDFRPEHTQWGTCTTGTQVHVWEELKHWIWDFFNDFYFFFLIRLFALYLCTFVWIYNIYILYMRIFCWCRQYSFFCWLFDDAAVCWMLTLCFKFILHECRIVCAPYIFCCICYLLPVAFHFYFSALLHHTIAEFFLYFALFLFFLLFIFLGLLLFTILTSDHFFCLFSFTLIPFFRAGKENFFSWVTFSYKKYKTFYTEPYIVYGSIFLDILFVAVLFVVIDELKSIFLWFSM